MGDFNANVRVETEDGRCAAEFELGARNKKGDRLVEFAKAKKNVIHDEVSLGTWT